MAHVVADTWSPVGGAGSARKSPPVATLTKAESPEQRGPHAFLEDLLSSCNPGFREMARRQLQGLTSDGGTISKSAKHAYSPEALAFLVEQRLYDPNPALREQARRILMEVAA